MLFRVLSGEYLKLKRTLALWMVLVSPLVMVLLQFAVSYKGAGVFLRDGKDAWPPMVRQTVEVWTLLMMPMFVTLETSLLAGLENTGKNWKSLLALPSPRWTVYVSKLVVTITLLWAAHAVLIGGTIGSGLLLKLLHPALNLGRMPLSPFVLPMLRVSDRNHSIVGRTRCADWRNDRERSASQVTASGAESRQDASKSVCSADAEGVGVSPAGRGDSALGEFEMAQLYGGNGLWYVRHDRRCFRSAIDGIRVLVSMVAADPCGVGRCGREGSNHRRSRRRRDRRSKCRLLGVCEAGNRVTQFCPTQVFVGLSSCPPNA